MPTYRVENLPISVSDAAVCDLCQQLNVALTEGPTIGSDYVDLNTVDELTPQRIDQIEDAVDQVLWKAIGKVRRIE